MIAAMSLARLRFAPRRGLALLIAAILTPAPASAIIGGAPEQGPLARHLVQVSICTGIVVAPDVVLTAAHCATGVVKWRDATGIGQSRRTREAKLFPTWKPGVNDPADPPIDLALLRLEAPLAPPFEPATLTTARPRPGAPAVFSGFGETIAGQADSAGELRSASAPVVEPYGREDNVVWLERDSKTGACKGDSGGALWRGEALAGVVTSILGPCGYRTRAVLVGPQRGWIDATLAAWGRKARWK
ncbi:MAG: S1 family peptidase [Methylobacteriaceae bacterium]|nr:S1 family peptidase [Methylobacteriaceae bacterium]